MISLPYTDITCSLFPRHLGKHMKDVTAIREKHPLAVQENLSPYHRVGSQRKLSAKELMLLNCGAGEDS